MVSGENREKLRSLSKTFLSQRKWGTTHGCLYPGENLFRKCSYIMNLRRKVHRGISFLTSVRETQHSIFQTAALNLSETKEMAEELKARPSKHSRR